MPHYGIFFKNGDEGISYLTTSILPPREFMPQYGIFVKNGDGGISHLTTFILPLREFMPHYGIFSIIGDVGFKLSDPFYSTPLRNYAPLWYFCHDWGCGL